jgi:glycosyltransferase involved in cell wall biosynthesis
MSVSLSVVVIGKNEEAYLARCLRSVAAAVEQVSGAEVVYVDSASTDRTVEIARSFGIRVLSLKPEWKLSPAAGRFVGFHHTSGELILFVDADTEVEQDFLRHAIPWFQQSQVAGIAGHLADVDEGGQPLPWVGERSAHTQDVAWLRGGCSLYRRSAMDQAGTFNPHLTVEEEAELALRLRRCGGRLLQIPHPVGCHLRGTVATDHIVRLWRHGRILGTGRTLRYACRAGNGTRFLYERFRWTLMFAVWLIVFCLGGILLMVGEEELAAAVALLLTAWLIAVTVKKRDPFGPLNYVALHGSFFVGLLAGAVITRVRDPQDYPLNVVEESPHSRSQVSELLGQPAGKKPQ